MRAYHVMAVALIAGLGCGDDDNHGNGGAGGATSSSGAGGSLERDGSAEVLRYDYAFDLTTALADAGLTAEVASAAECFSFATEPPINVASLNGATATSITQQDGVLRACGDTVEGPLTLATSLQVPEQKFLGLDVGFSRQTNKAGGTFTYLLSWVGGCDHFGPCDDDPSTFAEFHFEVTHPAGTTVLCAGALTAGDTSTRCDVQDTLAPTYSAFAIAADTQWVRKPFMSAAGVDLVFYEVPSGGLANGLVPADVQQFMQWVTTLLGSYPYGNELRIAGGPTRWLGFEHPGNIILYENLDTLNTDYADTLMHVFMHEVVHQWAGNRTTLASSADFVWKEAIAEYLPYVFEEQFGAPGQAEASRLYWDSAALQADYHPKPGEQPTPPVEAFYGDVYGPGPMVLFIQLEALIGQPAVLAGIQEFLSEPTARSVEDLQAALEQASGQDLSAYFNAWVYGSGPPSWPVFELATQQTAGEVTVTVTQTGNGPPHGCVVEVDVSSANETVTALIDFGLAPTAMSAQLTLPLADPVTGVQLDPRHRLVSQQLNAVAAPMSRPIWLF